MHCPTCGTATKAHFRFCGSCGGKLEASQTAGGDSQVDPNVLVLLATVLVSCAALTCYWY